MAPNDPEHALYPPPATQIQPQASVTPEPDAQIGAPVPRVPMHPAETHPAQSVRPLGSAAPNPASSSQATGPVWHGPPGTEPRPESRVQQLSPGEVAGTGTPMSPPSLIGGNIQPVTANATGGISNTATTLRPNATNTPQINQARQTPNTGVDLIGGPRATGPRPAQRGMQAPGGPGRPAPATRKQAPRPIVEVHDPTDRPNGGPANAMTQVMPQVHDPYNPPTATGMPRPANSGPEARGVQRNNPMENMAAGVSGATGVYQPPIQALPQGGTSNNVAANVNSMPASPGSHAVMNPGAPSRQPVGPSPFGGAANTPGPVQPMQPTTGIPRTAPGQPVDMTAVTPIAAEPGTAGGSIAQTQHGEAVMQTPQIMPVTAHTDGGDNGGPVEPAFPTPPVDPQLEGPVQPLGDPVNDGPLQPMGDTADPSITSATPTMQPHQVTSQPMPASDHAAGMHVNPGTVAANPGAVHSPVTQPVAGSVSPTSPPSDPNAASSSRPPVRGQASPVGMPPPMTGRPRPRGS